MLTFLYKKSPQCINRVDAKPPYFAPRLKLTVCEFIDFELRFRGSRAGLTCERTPLFDRAHLPEDF